MASACGWCAALLAVLAGAVGGASAPMRLPFTAAVSMWGLNGDGEGGGRVSAGAVGEALYAQLPHHTPFCGGGGGGHRRPMRFTYEMHYDTRHLPSAGLRRVEALLSRSFQPDPASGRRRAAFIELCPEFVDAFSKEVELALPKETFEDQRQGKPQHSILVLSPTKRAMRPAFLRRDEDTSDEEWSYGYRPCGGGGGGGTEPSAQWIGQGRVVVIDLSAAFSNSAFEPLRVPAATPRQSRTKTLLLRAEVESRAQHAVRSVLLPGMAWCSGVGAETTVGEHNKTVVPIFVLKDFGTAEHDNKILFHRWVRPALLHRALSMFLGPNQQLFVDASTHDLSDQGRVATTFFDSIQTETIFDEEEEDEKRRSFTVQHRSFVDGDMLLDRLRDAGESLTHDVRYAHMEARATGSQAGRADSMPRVVPAYVFVVDSREGDGGALAFRNGGRAHVTEDAVLVLHDASASLDLLQKKLVTALATSLFGTLGASYSGETTYALAKGKQSVTSSQSAVPSPTVASQCLIDAALRNNVLSRVDAAVTITVEAAKTLDEFTRTRLGDIEDFSGTLDAQDVKRLADLRQHPQLHTQHSIVKMVAYLRSKLAQMTSKHLADFAVQLRAGNVLALHKEATQLFRRAKEIHEETMDLLEGAEVTLKCCSLDHIYESDTTHGNGVWLSLIGGLLFIGLVAVASCWLHAAFTHDGERTHFS
eukprot:g1669.t1